MEKRLFFLLNMAQKRLFKHVDDICERELNASVTQLAALMFVDQQPGCSQKALTTTLGLNKSAVTGLVSRMEKNGLLQRQVSAADARAVELHPTEQGTAKTRQLKPLIDQLNGTFEAQFNAEEIATIVRFLNFIMTRFNEPHRE